MNERIGDENVLIILLGVLSDDERDLVNEIFSESNVLLYNISMSLLHSHADAEDAVAQTFLKVMEHIEKISNLPCPKVAPYCVIIVKNTAVGILRKRKNVAPLEDAELLADEDSADVLWKSMESGQLLESMEKLSEEDRYLISLRYGNELGFAEIGQVMGVSSETAKKRGQRALKKLRAFYAEGDGNVG